jgi:methionine-S-sulfoxide reductase
MKSLAHFTLFFLFMYAFTIGVISCNVKRGNYNHSLSDNHLSSENNISNQNNMNSDSLQTAIFGGGCFWCVEVLMQQIKGVLSVEPGYTGGHTLNPTYKDVCSGLTGHAEVVKVVFNPQILDYATLLEIFMTTHDPTTLNRQGGDVGTQYRSVIFFLDNQQKNTAENVLEKLKPYFDQPLVTSLEALTEYYPAEDYHHNYYQQNPEQSYCKIVISPKIQKLRKLHSDKLN